MFTIYARSQSNAFIWKTSIIGNTSPLIDDVMFFFKVTLSKTDLTHDFIIKIPAVRAWWCSEGNFLQYGFYLLLNYLKNLSSAPNETVTLVQQSQAITVEFEMTVQLMMSPAPSALTGWITQVFGKWIILWAYFTLSFLRNSWNIGRVTVFSTWVTTVSGELVKSRVKGWAGYDKTAERSVMDCHSKKARKAKPSKGSSDKRMTFSRGDVQTGVEESQLDLSDLQAVLHSSLFIYFLCGIIWEVGSVSAEQVFSPSLFDRHHE